MLCVCCVKGHKKESFSQSNSFYPVHAWFRSICALAFIMWWEGRQIEQDSMCVIYTSISLLVLFWGCRCLCVGALFVLSEILVPPRVPVSPALGPCGVQWGRRPTPSYITVLYIDQQDLAFILGSWEALGLDLIKCFCSVLNGHLLGDSHNLSTTWFWSKSKNLHFP